jgi:hypothetical protein
MKSKEKKKPLIINKLFDQFTEINFSVESRRCDQDATGKNLPEGRDFYGLWNYKLSTDDETIESEWPGFWNHSDMLNDLAQKIK